MTGPSSNVAEASQPKSFLQKFRCILKLVLINFLIFAVLAELASLILVHSKKWPSSRPSYHVNYNAFWADINFRSQGRLLHRRIRHQQLRSP